MSRESLSKHITEFQKDIRDANFTFWSDEIQGWAKSLIQFFESREPYDTYGLLDYNYILTREAISSLGRYAFMCEKEAENYGKKVAKLYIKLSKTLPKNDLDESSMSVYKQVLSKGLTAQLNRVAYRNIFIIENTLKRELDFLITNGHNTYSKSLTLSLQGAIDKLISRVKSIATTVSTSIISSIDEEVYKVVGDMSYKMWVAMLDEKTRITHAEVSDSVIPVGSYFEVGGSLMLYPGDPDGGPEEVINCRCFLVGVPRGEVTEDGDADKWLNKVDSVLVEI